MKFLSTNAIKGLILSLGTVSVVTTRVIVFNDNNSLKDNNKQVSVVEKGMTDTKNPNLVEAENEVNASMENLDVANKEVEKAESEKEKAEKEALDAENAITKAEETKKLAETEVQNAKTEEERNAALEKVKAAEEAINTAKETKKTADEKVQNAEKAVNEAKDNQKAAEERVQKAEDNKKTVEEAISKIEESEEQTPPSEEPKQETQVEEKQETNSKTESKTSTNKTKTESQNNNNTNKNVASSNSSNDTGRTLTDEQMQKMLEAAKEGEKLDHQKYVDEYTKKYGHAPEEEKTEVEFHFYSTLKDLKVRRNGDANHWAECGENGVNCIWFVEFSCDINECEGFAEPGSNELSGKVLIGRRGDTTEYIMQPPKAKPGYRFKAWEIVSANGTITQYGETGVLVSKYRAVYEKY